jgi:hypothetical protein
MAALSRRDYRLVTRTRFINLYPVGTTAEDPAELDAVEIGSSYGVWKLIFKQCSPGCNEYGIPSVRIITRSPKSSVADDRLRLLCLLGNAAM